MDGYQQTLAEMEADLYGSKTAFPMLIEVAGREYAFDRWDGQRLPDRLISIDTETRVMEGREVPELAITAVYASQGGGFFIHPADLSRFIQTHASAFYVAHNACFDFWTIAQHLQAEPAACAAWWQVAADGRLYCTMLGDALIRLGRIDAEPINRDLAKVASEYCPGIELDKSDPYRMRYDELIGIPADRWPTVQRGFFEYAGADPVATLLVAQQQFKQARDLIAPYALELLPGASRRFGPLTCCLQVQGAIALEYVSKAGIAIDTVQARSLRYSIEDLVEQHRQEMENLLPGAFKRYKKDGRLQRTAAGVPKRDAKRIKSRLADIADRADEPIRPPVLKDGTCTDAVKYWAQHADLDPFIRAYVSYQQQAKLAQFFKALDEPRIYPRYIPLVRTGRASCSRPNLQQLPRDNRFRQMIVAPPDHWLLQIDYSVLELRTLAQICLRRLGRSRMAELFQQDIDLHKYTASALMGISLEQFQKLPAKEQKQKRQQAKAINFGTPGGLGAESLVSYAKHAYGVTMTIDEAKQFRHRLITDIYPELQYYLADNQHDTISHNLNTSPAEVSQVFGRRKAIGTAARIISGMRADADGKAYDQALIDQVWKSLGELNKNPALMADLVARKPSTYLMRRIFYASAVTPSGRIRGHVGFSQRANSPFQGLAADGAKLALFRLLHAGYQVVGFIHDEALVLIDKQADLDASVRQVERIMCEAMAELVPDVPIACEYLLADRWYKDATGNKRDNCGRIIPYRRKVDYSNLNSRPGRGYDPQTLLSFVLEE